MSVTQTNWSLSATYDLLNPWPPADREKGRWVFGWGEGISYSQSMSLCSHSGSSSLVSLLFSIEESLVSAETWQFLLKIIPHSSQVVYKTRKHVLGGYITLWESQVFLSIRSIPLSFEPPKMDRIWNGKVPLWVFWPQKLSVHHFMFSNDCDTCVSAQKPASYNHLTLNGLKAISL